MRKPKGTAESAVGRDAAHLLQTWNWKVEGKIRGPWPENEPKRHSR